MSTNFFCKRVVSVSLTNVGLILEISKTQMHFLRNARLLFFRSFSSPKQHSFTVSYLINSCGLSQEKALSASRKVQFETPERADSVLAVLRDYGCTDTHISKAVSKYPLLLTADPEKTLLPKLEFFRSVGFSAPDIVSIVVSSPYILKRSLENQIIPNYNFLKGVVMMNENIVRAFISTFWFSVQNVPETVAANIATLQEIGVPISNIRFLVKYLPNVVSQNREKFRSTVKKVIEMGFSSLRHSFLNAVQVSCQLTEFTFEHKMEVYRRWGLTDDEIMLMFRVDPICMRHSEKKISSVMDFLVNKMGWEPVAIARYPSVFARSLEQKVIPRCSVVKVLQMKGLVKKDLSLSILAYTEKNFINRFVVKYEQDVPELLSLYKGKIGISDLIFASEEIWAKKQL